MKVYNSFAKRMLLCVLVAICLACNICAATWDKMLDHGAVSDDGIRHGDVRDGVVSDVSEEGGPIGEILTDVSDAIDHGMDSITEGTSATTKATAPVTTAATTAQAEGVADGTGGMTMGIVIAILVVIAVVIVIFLLFPKRG